VGRLLHRRLPADRLRLVSAVAFALFGVLLLVEGIRG
jgi:putative Ca2+/H+ antiporter (TMEM165/GDT1 family)